MKSSNLKRFFLMEMQDTAPWIVFYKHVLRPGYSLLLNYGGGGGGGVLDSAGIYLMFINQGPQTSARWPLAERTAGPVLSNLFSPSPPRAQVHTKLSVYVTHHPVKIPSFLRLIKEGRGQPPSCPRVPCEGFWMQKVVYKSIHTHCPLPSLPLHSALWPRQ